MRDWEALVRRHLDLPEMRDHREERMVSELATHLEDVFDDALRRGVTEEEAEALVMRELGDREDAARELIRSEPAHIRASANRWAERREERARNRGGPWSTVADIGQGLRLTLRTLSRTPLFTTLTILVLALGIGASAAIFSVVDGVILQALPYPNAERLVRVHSTDEGSDRDNFSGANLLDLRDQSEAFTIIAGYFRMSMNLVEEDGPRRLRGVSVTSDFFGLFGVDAYLGRTLSPAVDLPGGPRVVVLEHGLWQSAFGGDTEILGRRIELNDELFEVVGVMPPDFDYPNTTLWTSSQYVVPDPPFDFGEDPGGVRGADYIHAVGLLAEGASLDEAQSEMSLIADRLSEEYPETNRGEGIILLTLRNAITEDVRPALNVLLGAVGILLLIACANVANLLLARASSREGEIAVRRALGARRARIIGQLVTESTVLALVGGALGTLLAVWGTSALLALAPDGIPRVSEVGADPRFVAFAVLISLVTGVVTGLLPAAQSARRDLRGSSLFSGSRQAGSFGRSRVRKALVMGEVAFSLLLLVGAGLMVRTLVALNRVDPGFQPERTVAANASLPQPKYSDDDQVVAFTQGVLERVRALPGVQSAGMILSLPIRYAISGNLYLYVDGREPPTSEEEQPVAGFQLATPGYFETLGIPLRAGRLLEESDNQSAPKVAVVNEALARLFWPGESPIGERVSWSDPSAGDVEWTTIVGVVGNALQRGLDQDPRPEVYRPYVQAPMPYLTLVARTRTDASTLGNGLRNAVQEVDPQVPLWGVATMEEILVESLGWRRFTMTLLGAFAAAALLLAAVGLYGVLSYAVAERRREIGIRMALGARSEQVVRQVVTEGLVLALVGLVIGAGLALALARLMSSLIFQVESTDPITYLAGGAILLTVAVAACGLPAQRAAKLDPVVVLRDE